MNENRTSSFPADKSNNDMRDRILLVWTLTIPAMALGAHWVYTERDAFWGFILMALVMAQCACMALYYRASKNKNNNSAGT